MYHTTLLLKTIHHRHTLVAIGVVNHKLHIGALLASMVDADAYSAYLLVALNGLILLYRHRAEVGIDGDILTMGDKYHTMVGVILRYADNLTLIYRAHIGASLACDGRHIALCLAYRATHNGEI